MASVIRSLGITGISGYPLSVEVAIIAGLQTTTIVGLGDSAIKEAKDRMEACTEELGYAHPTKKVELSVPVTMSKISTGIANWGLQGLIS
ncbi:hypothetical protein SDC9_101234 [bioreactor metagenome]|uniref:Uncharacterized protein n=1 Tax=bioreactor metagenome TaxID=1076179 RepID=A0A645ANG4_9ZZZZ